MGWQISTRQTLDSFYGWVGSHYYRQHNNELIRCYVANWSKIWGGEESEYIFTKVFKQSGLVSHRPQQAALCCFSEILTSDSTMSSNIYCSGNYNFHSLGSYCHTPVNSSTALYFTGVNCGDAVCLPSQNRTWLLDNLPETCSKHSSYQSSSCVPKTCEISGYSSTTYCVSRPCRATSCFPINSYLSSSRQPSMCNRPQNYLSSSCCSQNHHSYRCQQQSFIFCGYQPLNFASSTCHPLRYLSYDCQSLDYVSRNFRPLDHVSHSFQFVPYRYGSFQPACFSVGTWQSPLIRRSCWIVIPASCQIAL